jgi:hypothetical protein
MVEGVFLRKRLRIQAEGFVGLSVCLGDRSGRLRRSAHEWNSGLRAKAYFRSDFLLLAIYRQGRKSQGVRRRKRDGDQTCVWKFSFVGEDLPVPWGHRLAC